MLWINALQLICLTICFCVLVRSICAVVLARLETRRLQHAAEVILARQALGGR